MSQREHAHQLIDRLPETQLSALVGLLETIVDPLAAALRNAPMDDEPLTPEEAAAIEQGIASLDRNGGVPYGRGPGWLRPHQRAVPENGGRKVASCRL